MTLRTAALLLTVAVFAVGCAAADVGRTPDEDDTAEGTATPAPDDGAVADDLVEQLLAAELPSSYVVEWETLCFCPWTRHRVTVVDGEVAAREAIDEDGTVTGAAQPWAAPSLRELVDRVRTEHTEGPPGAITALEVDADTGLPTHVAFDPIPDAVDDEIGFRLLELSVGDG